VLSGAVRDAQPSGRRRCTTWPGHPGSHRSSTACRTADRSLAAWCPPQPRGARPSLRTMAGSRPEQLLRRAADRPAGTDHPTDQLRTPAEHVGRRYRWDGLGQQRTHLRDVAVTHPARQLGGRQRAGIETGPRVAGVRTERLDLGDRRPGRSRRLQAPPAPTTPTRPPPRNYCGRTADPRTAAAHPPDTRPTRPPGPSAPPGSGRTVGGRCPPPVVVTLSIQLCGDLR